MTTIRAAAVIDLRFPTSRTLDGSDAMTRERGPLEQMHDETQ